MKGKYAAGLVLVDLPVEEVDVNVHPAKHEVRFRQSREVHNLICQAISEAMLEYQRTIKATIFGKDNQPDREIIPEYGETRIQNTAAINTRVSPDHQQSIVDKNITSNSSTVARFSQEVDNSKILQDEPNQSVQYPTDTDNRLSTAQTREPEQSTHIHRHPKETEHNLLIIGQMDDLYIFCRNSEGLVVIDQHAAHERLLYEKLRKQYLDGSVTRQTLMFPETIELSLFQAKLVDNNSEEIDRMGFSLSEFGGDTYVISAIPALAGQANPSELLLDILEQFGSEHQSGDKGGFLDHILATMACKAAVKKGTGLSHLEIDNLLNEMARADLFSHCPHGRPVIKQFTKEELKKWFHRS